MKINKRLRLYLDDIRTPKDPEWIVARNYDEFVKELSEKFNLSTLLRKIFAAQTCYTGKGCHS